MIILPLISFAALLFLSQLLSADGSESPDWRQAFVLASLTWGLEVFVFTEVLSLLRALTPAWTALSWLLSILVVIGGLVYLRRQGHVLRWPTLPPLTPWRASLLAGLGMVTGITLLIALVAPPNNWDSMTYHLPRVMHWIQNRSVAHYPTHILRQLYQSPWAEFAITHLQLLSGGDRFANLVQWFSMAGSLVAVSFIARQLGADTDGQLVTAVVAATIPMGILQASSTQNDYVLAFWIVYLAVFTLRLMQGGWHWLDVFGFAASLSLAILTKGTAYVYALPFVVWVAVAGVRRLGWRFWQPALAITALVIIVNTPHLWRNYRVFGSPLGEPGYYGNEVLGPAALASNVLRNLSLHVYAPPVGNIPSEMLDAFDRLHEWLGVGLNDPRTTLAGAFSFPGPFQLYTFHEDHAGNALHLLAIMLAFAVLLASPRLRRAHQNTVSYLAVVSSAFLLYSLIFKWQPWGSRLHLPFFVLASPLVTIVFHSVRPAVLRMTITWLFLLGALPFLLFNMMRPVLPLSYLEILPFDASASSRSNSTIFAERIFLYSPNPQRILEYMDVSTALDEANCSQLGLVTGIDSWEYPLWVVLKDVPEMRIEHVLVENGSQTLPTLDTTQYFPCAIVTVDIHQNKTSLETRSGAIYHRTSQVGAVSLFLR